MMNSSDDTSFIHCSSADSSASPISADYEVVEFPPKPIQQASSSGKSMIPLKTVSSHKRINLDDKQFASFRTAPLDAQRFTSMFDCEGRLISEHSFRQSVFRGGVEESIRRDVWCFLFNLYPCHSTTKEREVIKKQKFCQYFALKKRWQTVLKRHFPTFDLNVASNCLIDNKPFYTTNSCVTKSEDQSTNNQEELKSVTHLEAQIFANRVDCSQAKLIDGLRYISKDVPRTDRSHPYFVGDDNPHLLCLRDVLMAFCLLQPDVGYVQGMNDILARFLVVFDSEPIAFWCFCYYIVTVQKDFLAEGMLERIESLRNLLEHVDPDLHHYLYVCDVSEMIFCHKWLLLSFQREFTFSDAVALLEILSSYYMELHSAQGLSAREECRSNLKLQGVNMADDNPCEDFSFSLFVAAAILTLYRDRIFLCADGSQVHQFISSLSEQLVLDQILLQAERLFYFYCEKSVLDAFVLM